MRPGVRLGIDVGTARIGVARSDLHGMLATPVETVPRGAGDIARIRELVSEIDAASVAKVEWSAAASDAGGAERNLEVAVYWTRAAGDPEPVDLYLYRDAEGARPQLLFAGVTNRGDVAVPRPRLVVAWIDAAGVVAAVGRAPVVAPDASPLTELAPGAAADSMVVVAEPIPGGSMSDLVPIVWAMG